IRPGLTERRYRGKYQLGIQTLQFVIAQAEAHECPGTKGLKHNISFSRQLSKDLSTGKLVYIQGDTAFTGIVKPEQQAAVTGRRTVEKRSDGTHRVPARGLNLNDVRAHVPE